MVIHFPTRCTVENARDLKRRLLEALEAGGDVQCSFAQVEEADLSFFQLLTATQRSCQEAGVALVCARDLPPALANAAAAANWSNLIAGPAGIPGPAGSAWPDAQR